MIGHRLTVLLFATLIVVVASFCLGCSYILGRNYVYSKVYFQEMDMPGKNPNLDETHFANPIEGSLGDWIGKVWVWSVWRTNATELIKADSFKIGISFTPVPDSSVTSNQLWIRQTLRRETVYIDSLVLLCQPSGLRRILIPVHSIDTVDMSRALLVFGKVHLGPEVETITLHFNARLVDTAGFQIDSREYTVRLDRWVHRWNNWGGMLMGP